MGRKKNKYVLNIYLLISFKAYIYCWQYCSCNVNNIVHFEYCIELCDEWVNH